MWPKKEREKQRCKTINVRNVVISVKQYPLCVYISEREHRTTLLNVKAEQWGTGEGVGEVGQVTTCN